MKNYIKLLFIASVLTCVGYSAVATADTSKLTPKCKTPTEENDAACWMRVQNQHDCYAWNWAPASEEKLTNWTGQCTDGLATGMGEGLWEYRDDSVNGFGEFVDGKPHGPWKLRWESGYAYEGLFTNGEKNGRWIERFPNDEMVAIGSYVNSEEQGKWEFRYADGRINDVVYDKGEQISNTPRVNPKFEIKGKVLYYNTDLATTEAGQEIITDDLDFFKKVLQENSDIKMVRLTSWGGDSEASSEIADLIIDYGLDTHVVDICFSGCTTLLLSGKKRTLEKGSKVGFHRSWWDVNLMKDYYEENKEYEGWGSVFEFAAWVHEDAQEEIYKDFEFLLERGVDSLFAIKTLKAKADDGWYPRRKELLDANFLTE